MCSIKSQSVIFVLWLINIINMPNLNTLLQDANILRILNIIVVLEKSSNRTNKKIHKQFYMI